MVQFVLTSMLVYLVMAMDLPPWALKAIDKIRRGFLWKGRKDVNGGHCLLAWPKVARPQELGGLGISSLQQLGWALRMRWLWLQKTEPDKPWASFAIHVHPAIHSFFSTAIKSEVVMEGIPCSGQNGGSMDRGSMILCRIYLVQSHQGQGSGLSRMLSLIRDGLEIFMGLYLWLS